MSKNGKRQKGILGVRKDPKKQFLIVLGSENWTSEDDSSDSDYSNFSHPNTKQVKKKKKKKAKPMEPSKNPTNSIRQDDSAIEVDSSLGDERSDNSQCSPSDGHESRDSGAEVRCLQKKNNGKASDAELKKNNAGGNKKEAQRQKWVVSNGTNSDGIMTLKIRLDDNPKKNRKRKKEPKPPKENGKKIRKTKSKTDFSKGDDPANDPDSAEFVEGPWGKRLPMELLVRIFQEVVNIEGVFPFLDRAEKVCQLWQRASEDRLMWDNVDLSSESILKSDVMLAHLFQKRDLTITKRLNLSGWGNELTHIGIKTIASKCQVLNTIILKKCTMITANCLKVLVDSCAHLSHIDISGVAQKPNSLNSHSPVSVVSLKYIFEKCGSHLTFLSIAENFVGKFSTTVKNLAKYCPMLEVLDASNIRSNVELVLPVEDLQIGCPRIKVLRMANSHFTLASTPLSAQGKAPGFPELEELSVAHRDDKFSPPCVLGDNDLDRLLKTSHKIKLLDVRRCQNISVSGLVRVPAWDIEHLHLSRCEATRTPDLELVLKKWRHSLRDVDLSWANNSTSIDHGVMALASMDEESPLEAINLCGSAVSFPCIQSIMRKCTKLQTVNLQSCRGLPRGIKRLYAGPELVSLREIENVSDLSPS